MKNAHLIEDRGPKPGQRLLTDSLPLKLQLVEDDTGGKLVVRGEFARAGLATENKRVYPRTLWEREISKLDRAMQERRMFGELDHPNDGRTQLTRVSHLVTSMNVTDRGIVLGEAEVLDTARGRDLRAMLNAGCKVGVSSRGYGSTRTNDKGEEVVQEDYTLVTFDFVAEPADSTAYPDVFSENKETTGMGTEAQKQEDQAKAKAFAARVEQEAQAGGVGRADLASQFENDILSKLGKLNAEAKAAIRSQLMADPSVGAAKEAIESIKTLLRPFLIPEDVEAVVKQKDEEISRLHTALKERDLRIKTQEEQISSLGSMARQAGYKFYLERALAGNPDKVLIVKTLGDLTQFESAETFKEKVAGIVSDFEKRRVEQAAEAAVVQRKAEEQRKALAAESARSKQVESSLSEQVTKLTTALEKSLEANKALGIQLYTERRLATHPRGKELTQLVESRKPKSQQEVERLIEENALQPENRDADELEAVRARVRNATRGAKGSTPVVEEETRPRGPRVEENYNGLGIDLTTLKQLSGINGSPAGGQRSLSRR